MLTRDMNMSTLNASFNLAPKAFQRIGVVDSVDVFPAHMANSTMRVSFVAQVFIRGQFIGADCASRFNMIFNNWFKGIPFGIGNNFRHNITAALHHAKNNRLSFSSTSRGTVMFSAYPSLIGLNVAG